MEKDARTWSYALVLSCEKLYLVAYWHEVQGKRLEETAIAWLPHPLCSLGRVS